MNAQKGEEFRKYRDSAPEGVEDATIISLIQRSAGNNAAITAAIENMWHDLSDEKAIGGQDQWNTASKANKKKEVPSNQGHDRGGRGGRGRGIPPAGGRGQGAAGGRGGAGRGAPSQGRGASVTRPPASHVPHHITAPTAPITHVAETQQVVAAVTAAPAAASTQGSVSATTGTLGWGWGGTTLAEKLKQAEIQKLLPPTPAPAVVQVSVIVVDQSESLTDGDISSPDVEYTEESETVEEVVAAEEVVIVEDVKVEIVAVEEVVELIEQIVELTVQDPLPVVVEQVHTELVSAVTIQAEPVHVSEVPREREIVQVQVQELVQESSVPKAFLKMGKWEAPESSAFQFGSFGNFGNSTSEDSIVMSAPGTWGGVAESADLSQQQGETASGSWGGNGNGNSNVETSASSSSGPSTMSALFPQPKGLSVQSDGSQTGGSSSQNQGRYDQKPSAPPGLDPHPHSGMTKPLPIPRQDSRTVPAGQSQTRGKHEANQLQQQQYQPQQYQQPAAVPPTARGAPQTSSMPYGYAPGFDPQSQYQASYQPAPVMAPPVTGSSPVTAPGTPSTQPQGQGQIPIAPQGQLQYGPPPGMPSHYANPYYANPYYGNPYFYGQPQVQNPYYNQGRDYQSSRPYGADPYAPGVQYPVYQQNGSFPDSSGAYPSMPMQQQQQQHPSMGSQSQGAAAAPGAPAAGQSQGQGKQQKGVSASSAPPQQQQQQQQQQQDPNQGYGYNPYNPREAQWQYQQGTQGWGGANMMGFSVGPGSSPPSQGFPQGPAPQQSTGQRPSTSYGGPPGHGQGQQHQSQQGQSFSRGPAAPNATGQGPSSGAGQHW